MKKQIITIASVALATVILFVTYAIFFMDDGIDEIGDPFYQLSDEVVAAMEDIDEDVTVTLNGYDGDDDYWSMIYRFVEAYTDVNSDIELETADSSLNNVVISVNGSTKTILFENFFKERYDGVRYAFDGEKLITNAILSLCGKKEMAIELRALAGYDTDGDNVTANNAPFMFTSLQRSEVQSVFIKNKTEEYALMRDETGEFHFSTSYAAKYDEEMFSLLTTNCRYVVASYGKMDIPEGRSWDDYGLNDEKPSTAQFTVISIPNAKGEYFIHTVYIGNLSSTGTYYFARYIGGMYKEAGVEGMEGDESLHNLTKGQIYLLPVSSVDDSITLPSTAIMTPSLIGALTDTTTIYTQVDDIRVDDYSNDVSLVAKKMSDFNPAPNLAAIDTTSVTKVISDKASAKSDYSSYEGGWTKHIDVFAGFSSSDGKNTYLEAALARRMTDGNYRVKFGILRDDANGAVLPEKVILTKSYDGINWVDLEGAEIEISHADKSVYNYEFSFTDTQDVKFIRFYFDVSTVPQTYIVFDEIRIFVDGQDAQPFNVIGGQWKLIAPSEMIPEGKNYNFLDMTNFTNFVQTLAGLEGERVVACGFSDDGDANNLNNEILAKYGLENPDKHYTFTYDGITVDLYVSKPNEDGKYYAYSVFSGDVEGEHLSATSDVICEISTETAPFLKWDMTEYLDHSLFSIYLDDITELTVTSKGVAHTFVLGTDENDSVVSVLYNGKNHDLMSFKYFYQTLLSIYMQDKYIPEEGEEGEEYFRIKINTETNSPEIVFYRISASRCYFTVDGSGGYYVLVEDVNNAIEDLETYISGGIVTRR